MKPSNISVESQGNSNVGGNSKLVNPFQNIANAGVPNHVSHFEAKFWTMTEMSVFPDSRDLQNSSATKFACFYELVNKWQ